MASRTTVTLVDDLDGETADETVEFGLDHAEYEIDLTSAHAGSSVTPSRPTSPHARRTAGGRPVGPGRAARTVGAAGAASPQSRERNQGDPRLGRRARLPAVRARPHPVRGGGGVRRRRPGRAAHARGDRRGPRARTRRADRGGRARSRGAAAADEPARGRDGLTGEERETIRAWADGEGIEVKPRGQLKKDLIANYRAWEARQ